MLDAVRQTAEWTRHKLDTICALSEATRDHVRSRRPKVYTRELVDVLFERPYCRIANVVEAGIVARQAAARQLKQLVEIGVLREISAGKEKLFLHSKLLSLLTSETNEFEAYRSG